MHAVCAAEKRGIDKIESQITEFLERILNVTNATVMAFSEDPVYSRFEGFRTRKTSVVFIVLWVFVTKKAAMADPTGFEPVTSAFGGFNSTYPKHTIEHVVIR